MNAIPYDRPEEEWDGYPEDDVDERRYRVVRVASTSTVAAPPSSR